MFHAHETGRTLREPPTGARILSLDGLSRVTSAIFAVLFGLFPSANIHAQTAQQRAACSLTANMPPATVIDGCSAVLSERFGTGHQRAVDLTVRGRAHTALGQLVDAITDYSEAIRADPAYGLAYYSRGIAHFNKSEFEPAIADYTQALQFMPNDIITLQNRGHAYQAKQDFDHAIADYSAAIKVEPRFAFAYNDRCYARAIEGRELQLAVADCNEALRLKPNDIHILDSRALTYLKLADFEKAVSDYTAIVQTNPRHAASLYGRGWARQKLGDTSGGGADIAAAKAVQPDIVDVFARYGLQ